MTLPNANKATLAGFETQRRDHQKSKTGVSVAPHKRTNVLQNFSKKNQLNFLRQHVQEPARVRGNDKLTY